MGSNERPAKLLSQALGNPLPSPRPTVYDLISTAADANLDRTALVCMHQQPDFLSSITNIKASASTRNPPPYLSWTFAQLKHTSHVLAASLAEAGIKPGMTIMTLTHNCAEFHLLFWAALELNCIFAPIQPRVGHNQAEAEHVLGMISPSVLFVQEELLSKVSLLPPELISKVALKFFSPAASPPVHPITPHGWEDFPTFCEKGLSSEAENAIQTLNVQRSNSDAILVMTTSGTTALPKGCVHTNTSFGSGIRGWQSHASFLSSDSSLVHMPLSHIMGLLFALTFHASGLKCVHPSPAFTPLSTLAAIRHERCTYIPGVPAMVHALLAHPDFKKAEMDCVRYTMLGATTILPETLRMTMEEMGSGMAFAGYGMTETGPTLLHRTTDAVRSVPEHVTCGTVFDGGKVRVCKFESASGEAHIVERGVPGELHIGGDIVIKEYWFGKGKDGSGNGNGTGQNDLFYTDEEGRWFKSGDQAIMHENGEVEIVGRYKDMIIRGGENISPLAIESILLSRFGLIAEVIGVPDEIAGEIPLAIIKRKPGQEVSLLKIRETLLKELGAAWVPEEIVDVETMGIEDFPRTSSGKVQKYALRKIAMDNRQVAKVTKREKPDNMVDSLLQIWTELLKLAPGTLTPSTSVHDWADSLILARFSGVLHRQTGLQMNIQELTANPTIQAQAALLSTRNNSSSLQPALDMISTHPGPPTMEDMVHTLGDPERFARTKTIAEETLAPFGLSWDDVEDVIPMGSLQDFYIRYRRPQSNNHRHALLCPGATVAELQVALESALVHHSMLRTMAMYFDATTPLHIAVRPSAKWYSHCITIAPPVKTSSELSTLVYNDPVLDFACFPGPMFRMVLTHVEEENSAGIAYQGNHSVFDAISLPPFLDDLEALLANPSASITAHVPYKAWADHMYMFQDSALAQASVKWHTDRLRGISSEPKVAFPIQRAPEWFKGNSTGWVDITTGKPGPERKPLDAHPIGVTGIKGIVSLPDIQALKIKHGIDGSQIVKAALAVLTTEYTKQKYALFGQSQAGRTWPFLPEWQVARMPSAMDANGPCVQGTVNKISVSKDEKVLDILSRLQAEQHFLSKHAHVPTRQLAAALNSDGSTDGDFMQEVFRRQIFNWLPSPPDFSHERLKVVQIESRTDCGLLWNCMMLDRTTLQIHATWDDAQLSKGEIQEMLDGLLNNSAALAQESNWDKKVGDVL